MLIGNNNFFPLTCTMDKRVHTHTHTQQTDAHTLYVQIMCVDWILLCFKKYFM